MTVEDDMSVDDVLEELDGDIRGALVDAEDALRKVAGIREGHSFVKSLDHDASSWLPRITR